MIRKLIIGNGRSEREILLVGNIVIGRDPACHVSEPDPLLSRRHAEIIANVHGVSVRDLDSRNGILVNGEKTREQVLLPGDVVQFGHLQLRFIEENARAADGMASRGMDLAPRPLARRPRRARPSHLRRPPRSIATGPTSPAPAVALRRRVPVAGGSGADAAAGAPHSAPPPPPPAPRHRVIRRFRAAAPHSTERSRFRVRTGQELRQDVAAPRPAGPCTTTRRSGHAPARLDATMLAPLPRAKRRAGIAGLTRTPPCWRDALPPDSTMMPGNATFASALDHLPGSPTRSTNRCGHRPGRTPGRQRRTHDHRRHPGLCRTARSAGDELIGDSLTDVFLRGVRRAYAEPGSVLSLGIAARQSGLDHGHFHVRQDRRN